MVVVPNRDEPSQTEDTYLSRIKDLEGLGLGWLDGQGLPVSPLVVAWARRAHPVLSGLWPYVYPTEEGGLFLEWPMSEMPSLEVHFVANNLCVDFHAMESVDRLTDLLVEMRAIVAPLSLCVS